jgi:hypothetical protein
LAGSSNGNIKRKVAVAKDIVIVMGGFFVILYKLYKEFFVFAKEIADC